MKPLDKTLRNALERTVKKARDIAEDGAYSALGQLGVGEAKAFDHLSEDERELRRKLRLHGRHLGDKLNQESKQQELARLAEEVAYEHWHRMLFARFLADNNLLMYPDPEDPVAVSLEECEDLAEDEGARNGWELAAQYASKMLPQIFREHSPVLSLDLPPENRQSLERLISDLDPEVFTASDSLGWVYQFWQDKRKDEVNKSEVKIGARELPAVTQLFTEDYMVEFLIDNSLGAWFVSNFPDVECPIELTYLRTLDDGTPASGKYEQWPKTFDEFTMIDPSCGSGHFLVAIFLKLVPMRMAVERLSAKEACDKVLEQNIHGLELDQRCVELAAFALAFTAWTYPDEDGEALGFRQLPEFQLACSGQGIHVKKSEWLDLLPEDVVKQAENSKIVTGLRYNLEQLYDIFKDAPTLGSLINPNRILQQDDLFGIDFSEAAPLLAKAFKNKSDDSVELGIAAAGLAKAAHLLCGSYTLVVTNVPYLKSGKQDVKLQNFCEKYYPEGRADLATAFFERCLEFCEQGGSSSIVLPQNWLFQTTYKEFREQTLLKTKWNSLAQLGSGAFETISGEVVKAILITVTNLPVQSESYFSGIDVSTLKTPQPKAEGLKLNKMSWVNQMTQLENKESRVSLNDYSNTSILDEYCTALFGSAAGDVSRFTLSLWEVPLLNFNIWELHQSTTKETNAYSGRDEIIRWEKENGQMFELADSVKHLNHKAQQWRSGKPNWGKKGITVNLMGKLPATLYTGEIYAAKCTSLVPKDSMEHLYPAIWSFCSSKLFKETIEQIFPKLSIEVKELLNVPFEVEHWQKVADEKYPNGLPLPYSDDPTQWIFHGHPCGSVIWDEETKWTSEAPLRKDNTVLQVAVARLLGYEWPAELDAEMELAEEQRAWVERAKGLSRLADNDGIVCIPAVRGEKKAADRVLDILAASYGDEWSTDVLGELLKESAHAGKSLDSWLRDKFFTQHFKLFGHRPFVWHFWDGLNDGFSVLVNYHKLDYKLLETLIYTYLGDWITTQHDAIASGLDGSEEKLAAAESLKKKLELILQGEAPIDIFVRWKPLDKQPIGWNPDINDGVRLNIRPFMSCGDVKKKDTGVLRDKPNIHWKKDRGTDVVSAPWYHLGPKYGEKEGSRINDHHLTIDEKKAGRSQE